ncbi:tRNA (guanosine(46)-N7)-methyltransferase TrmB [Campylobacter sp. MG1]|uniref:tRNA (guanosine(46)-N7)-methyltransferase TrmB n=1 Tax=Campylobacter sp. MG1 TaxID=2976332 RepID=UPI00226CC4BA|nr:tRNA (guanosine(46)-N7)-methyltransferase TrmB [Campylobacter sp. MG1]
MPNFKTKEILNLELPVIYDGVKFNFSTTEYLGVVLVHTSIEDKSFFIQINHKKDEFVIKIDKMTKITDLALMQKALMVFEKYFCKNIISRAYGFNDNKKLANNIISNVSEFKNYINNTKKNIYLEIGFGSGRHLIYQAKNNPENIYIGIEIYKPSLIQVSKLAKYLNNVLLLDFDARIAIKELENNTLDGVFLHFPVPWDDAVNRRVVSTEFRDEIMRVLKNNAFFELRSDSLMYVDYTKNIFSDFNYDFFKNKNAKIISKYESRWLKNNKNIYDFIVYKSNNNEIVFNKNDNFKVNFKVNFKKIERIKYVCDDFFVKINRIYNAGNFIILQVAYGSFDTPSNSYLLCEEGKEFKFLFYEFCPNNQNIKAFNKLKEYLE